MKDLLRGVEVAAADAKVAGGADHATCQAQRVVAEDGFGSTVVVLLRQVRWWYGVCDCVDLGRVVCLLLRQLSTPPHSAHTQVSNTGWANLVADAGDERLDVQLRRAALLARRIRALQTAGRACKRGIVQKSSAS